LETNDSEAWKRMGVNGGSLVSLSSELADLVRLESSRSSSILSGEIGARAFDRTGQRR
jgi:hypothetical protein